MTDELLEMMNAAPPITIYMEHGFPDREAYLKSLAVEYEVDEASVFYLAELLGHDEDFDGLPEDLKDFSSFII